MATLKSWEVVDHGVDGDSYFPGCGTAHTQYDYVETGRGDTPREALDDALEMLATAHDVDVADSTVAEMREHVQDAPSAHDSTVEAVKCQCMASTVEGPEEHEGDCPAIQDHDCEAEGGGTCNPEWAYRVSIRYTLGED